MSVRIIQGDALTVLKTLPAESVHCCVTSPPYWGLRDYGIPPSVWGGDPVHEHEWGEARRKGGGSHTHTESSAQNGKLHMAAHEAISGASTGTFCSCGAWLGCFGLEPTPALYVEHSVMVFREIRRVLRDDATLWLNLGDSYATGAGAVGNSPGGGEQGAKWRGDRAPFLNGRGEPQTGPTKNIGPMTQPNRMPQEGHKPKDLCEIPSDVVRALRADGWWLRSRIPWLKRNAMPESTKDRPTTAVEYVFLLSKSKCYFYDGEAVKIKSALDTHPRYARGRSDKHKYADGGPGNQTIAKTLEHMQKPVSGWDTGPGDHRGKVGRYAQRKLAEPGSGTKANTSFDAAMAVMPEMRARRNSDWFFESWQGMLQDEAGDPLALIVNPQPFKEAHFATFPPALIEPCILAGCPEGGTVLDPFFGAGTTGLVADRHGRNCIGIELNPQYAAMSERRIQQDAPLFTEVTA